MVVHGRENSIEECAKQDGSAREAPHVSEVAGSASTMARISPRSFARHEFPRIHLLLIECLRGIHKFAPAGLENQAKRAAVSRYALIVALCSSGMCMCEAAPYSETGLHVDQRRYTSPPSPPSPPFRPYGHCHFGIAADFRLRYRNSRRPC